MFSLMKKRNEAARQKKMDHIFQKADENGNGKITPQQMVKAFAANDVTGNYEYVEKFNVGSNLRYLTHKEHHFNLKLIIFSKFIGRRCIDIGRQRRVDHKK